MSEKKSFLDDIARTQKPESFSQEKFVSVNGSGGRIIKTVVSIAVIIILAAAALITVNIMGRITVPELVGMDISDAASWAAGNKITLSAKSVYDFDNEEGIVLSQATEAGMKIDKNSTILIQVSLGADPEEQIVFPDILGMTAAEIDKWIIENKLTGVRTETVYSNVVASDNVISYSFTDGSESSFKRKNRVVITISKGTEGLSETIIIPDLTSYKTGALYQWGNENGVKVNIVETFDDYIPSGSVITQSVKANTEIKRSDGVTVLISTGKAIIVPDFTGMLKDEMSAWAKLNGITIITLEKYSDTFKKGKICGQNIAAGDKAVGGSTIIVDVSLGRIEIGSYIGKSRLDILNWQDQVNEKGAGINLVLIEEFGAKGSYGKIISQSVRDDFIDTGSTITVTLSKGMKVITPDFAGKNLAECNEIAKNTGISVIYDYKQSGIVDKDYVISQSPEEGTVISDNDTVMVVISLTGGSAGRITVADFSAMKKDSIIQWGISNGVNIGFREEFNDYISAGSVISQSVVKNSVIRPADYIEVVISRGPAVTIPDFGRMSQAEASLWAKANSMSITFTEVYSNTYEKGALFGQSIQAGTKAGANTSIACNCSLGLVSVTSFIGKTRLDVLNWQNEVNSKGADIKLSFTEGYGDKGTAGTVKSQSVRNDMVNINTVIDIVISLGKQILMPDLLGTHETVCVNTAANAGISIIMIYEYSDTVDKGYVIKQSYDKDTVITDATVVIITVSSGPRP